MSKTRDTGYLANVIQVHDTGVRIMSGSTMLMAVSSSGEVTVTGVISGSNALSSSYAISGSYAVSSSYAFTASSAISSSKTISSSYADTASYANTFTVGSTLTAQTLVVQTITSSIDYVTGSTRFGSLLGNTHTFTGSIYHTGSIVAFAGNVGIGTSSPPQSLTANGNIAVGGQQAFWLRDDDGFSSNSGRRAWAITANYSSYGTLTFFVANSAASNPLGATAALNITNVGSVGIGTTNPQAKLHISGNMIIGADGAYALISGPTTGGGISIGSNSATFDRNLYLGLVTAGLSFSPVLTINAQTSNVGIGICTPDRRLYISDTSATQGTFLAYNQCTTFCGTVIEGITDRTSNCAFNLMNLKASTTSMFLVRGDGNIGVGTANPATTSGKGIHIYSNCGHANLSLESCTSGVKWEILSTTACNFVVYQAGGGGDRFTIAPNGNVTFACNVTSTGALTSYAGLNGYAGATQNLLVDWSSESQVTTLTNTNLFFGTNAQRRMTISNTGIATFACNICVAKYLTVGSQGGGDIVFLGGGSGVGAAIEARYADGNPNVRLAGNGNSWINRSYGNVGIGTCTPSYMLDVNGAINSSAGTMYSNSVVTYAVGGTMAGYTAAYYDFPVWNDTDQGQMIEIKAFFDHFYNWNYGTHYYIYLTSRATSTQALTIFNCTTGNGGSWMAYKPNATTLRVCKIAGSYGGGGAFWIQVTSKQP